MTKDWKKEEEEILLALRVFLLRGRGKTSGGGRISLKKVKKKTKHANSVGKWADHLDMSALDKVQPYLNAKNKTGEANRSYYDFYFLASLKYHKIQSRTTLRDICI